MFMRFTITIMGEYFAPKTINNLLLDSLKIIDICDFDKNTLGVLQIQHIDEFANYRNEGYENSFIGFFEKNFISLNDANAENFSIFMEIYYKDQCNFEIFDSEKLHRLTKFGVNLPISVYHIDTDEI